MCKQRFSYISACEKRQKTLLAMYYKTAVRKYVSLFPHATLVDIQKFLHLVEKYIITNLNQVIYRLSYFVGSLLSLGLHIVFIQYNM